MRLSSLKFGILFGGLTSLSVMALLYLGEQIASLPFVPFDLFDWLARVLPGDIIVLGISGIVNVISLLELGNTSESAKAIEQLMGIVLFIGIGVVMGGLVAWLTKRDTYGRNYGLIAGGIFFLIFSLIISQIRMLWIQDIIWLAIIIIGWGGIIQRLLRRQPGDEIDEETRAARRQLLVKIAGGSLGLAIGAWGIGKLLDGRPGSGDVGASQPLSPETEPLTGRESLQPETLDALNDRIPPAPGTRDELTTNENFYRIDINTRPPIIQEENWALEIEGLFDNPRPLSLQDIMQYPSVSQPVTMACISNRIGGDLIGTSNWTGPRLRDVMSDMGIQNEARFLLVEAIDSFYETVSMIDLLDPRTLLVYGMNGETLPVEHGFPLRIYIPDRYGMKQPKWITKITAVAEDVEGYWVARGWSKEARPQIISIIDAVSVDQPTADGKIPIGGIAWAGDRGIEKVELQIDGGEWTEATLRTPTISPLTWVQWRYDWEASSGGHNIQVRATDGTGQLQTEEERGTRPDGATGYHSQRVRV